LRVITYVSVNPAELNRVQAKSDTASG